MATVVFSKKKPKNKHLKDIGYGFNVSRHLKNIGAGRCVVVKNVTIMAVEAATDGIETTVERGCLMARKDAFVVINGDNAPTVLDEKVLHVATRCKSKGIAFIKDSVSFENFEQFIKTADSLGLILLAFDEDKPYNIDVFQ